jgi:predicted DNA-binding transcriptional regulator AlpA
MSEDRAFLRLDPPAPPIPEPLLTAEQVAKILGVRPKRVYELGIPAVRLSERSLRWRPSQVEAWIRERERAA